MLWIKRDLTEGALFTVYPAPKSPSLSNVKVSWLAEAVLILIFFVIHFGLGDDHEWEQNLTASIAGFLIPSFNITVFPLIQGSLGSEAVFDRCKVRLAIVSQSTQIL